MRKGQAVVLGVAAPLALLSLMVTQSTLGLMVALMLALAGAFVAMFPINGRTVEQWAPTWVNFRLRRKAVEAGYRSRRTTYGVTVRDGVAIEPPPCLPPQLVDLDLLSIPRGKREVGVIRDRRKGTFTAVMKVKAGAFAFEQESEQNRRLEAYGLALASATQDGSAIERIQWIERTVPQGGDEMASYLQRARDERDGLVPLSHNSVASYIALVEEAAPTAQEHELLVAVQISQRAAAREVKRLGNEVEAYGRVLFDELEAFADNLSRGGVQPLGLLTPRQYAASIRDSFDPWGRENRRRVGVKDHQRADLDPGKMGPRADETRWNYYRADGAVHIAFCVESWPRIPVHASFMMPLLMQGQAVRAVSTVMAPVPMSEAMRKAEAQQTVEDGEELRRQRKGGTSTARARRRAEAVTRVDEELAAGHGQLRFVGYIVVSGRTVEEAEENGRDMVRAALRVGCSLQRMDGDQDHAFAFGLPLARGLA